MARRKRRSTPRRQCGTMIAHQRLLESDPGYRMRLIQLESQISARLSVAPAVPALRTVKVHVHVVYRTPQENVGMAQIRSQIAALNRDYGAANADKSKTPAVWKGLVGDARIRFKLVGVTRKATAEIAFSTDDHVKVLSPPVTPNELLNVWVCTLGGGLLGYAQFPGGPAKTDGVVVLNTAFGTVGTAAAPFDLGRSATHECGHYFNLHHIWGDGGLSCTDSDYVNDTPNQEAPNYGKPAFPHVSCHNGPNGDMFMNYMDYVDDAAMVMFSAQQRARMHATLAGPRSGL